MTDKKLEAGDFVKSYCKKCKEETKNVVVALVKGVPSKVQCTNCKGNHLFAAKPGTKSKSSAAKGSAMKVPSPEWEGLSAKWDSKRAVPYVIGGIFKKGDLLDHKQFGLGVVRAIADVKRMQVLFQYGEKTLHCG